MESKIKERVNSQLIDITYDYVFIGGGLFTLIAAHEALRCGFSVLILEKSRGLGGRLSRRRISSDSENFEFFHGAPHKVFPQNFEELKATLRPHCLTEALVDSVESLTQGRFEVRGGRVGSSQGSPAFTYRATKGVFLNPPLPQSLALLPSSVQTDDSILFRWVQEGAHFYQPSLIAMIQLDRGTGANWENVLRKLSCVERVEREARGGDAVLVELSPDFTREHLEEDGATWFESFRKQITFENPGFGDQHASSLKLLSTHRWRYARYQADENWFAKGLKSQQSKSIQPSSTINPVEIMSGLWLAGDFLTNSNAQALIELSANWASKFFKKENQQC